MEAARLAPITIVPLKVASPLEFKVIPLDTAPICIPLESIESLVVLPSFNFKVVDVISTCSVDVLPIVVVAAKLATSVLSSTNWIPVLLTCANVFVSSPKAIRPLAFNCNFLFASAWPTPSKNFVVVPKVATLMFELFRKSIPAELRTTCVSIVSIADWAVAALLIAVLAFVFAVFAVFWALVAFVFAVFAVDCALLAAVFAVFAVDWAAEALATEPATAAAEEPLICSANCADPLTIPPGSPAEISLPAVIVIWPATFTLPLEASNFIWLPLALPAKKLPAPSIKTPIPLLCAVGGVAPRAILPLLSVDKSKVDVSIFKSLVTNSKDVPVNVSLLPLALPTLKSPLLLMNTPVPLVLVAVEAFDVSNAKLSVFSNNLLPPFNSKFCDAICTSPLPSWDIKLVALPVLNWPSVKRKLLLFTKIPSLVPLTFVPSFIISEAEVLIWTTPVNEPVVAFIPPLKKPFSVKIPNPGLELPNRVALLKPLRSPTLTFKPTSYIPVPVLSTISIKGVAWSFGLAFNLM